MGWGQGAMEGGWLALGGRCVEMLAAGRGSLSGCCGRKGTFVLSPCWRNNGNGIQRKKCSGAGSQGKEQLN